MTKTFTRFAILSLICLFSRNTFAQNNMVEVSLGGYTLPGHKDRFAYFPTNNLGFHLQRKLLPKLSVRAGFSWVRTTFTMRFNKAGHWFATDSIHTPIKTDNIFLNDTIIYKERYGYKYVDLGISYNLLTHKRHHISLLQSASYAWGKNYTITQINPPFTCIILSDDRTENVHYFGGATGLSYSYNIFKHIQVGTYAQARYYFGDFPFMFQYGIGLGVQF